MILTLIQNISILIALSAAYQIVASKLEKRALRSRVLFGILFGGFGVIGMMTPLRYAPGIIYDGRSIILGVSGLIGGPVTAVIAACICAAYRFYLGGAGAVVGISVIAEAAAVGVGFHYLRHRYQGVMDLLPLLGFGLLIHTVMLLLMLGLPGGVGMDVLRQITLPVLLVYPPATMLLARTVYDAERQLDAEKALRENEEKYRNLVENSTGIIWETDTSGRFTYISGQTQTILGYTPSEMHGRPAFDFMEPTCVEENKERFRSAREDPSSVLGTETSFVKRNGSIAVVETRATPVFTLRGAWAGFRGIDIDITERKKTEKALRRSHLEKAILNEIANVFLTVHDDRTYGEVLTAIVKAMACKHGFFGYIEANGDLVIPGVTQQALSQCRVERKAIVFPVPEWTDTLWGEAIRGKRSVSSTGPFRIPEGHLPIRNALVTPIVFGGDTIGLIAAANKEEPFKAEDQTLLEYIAVNISPILNARLQRDRQELVQKRMQEALARTEAKYRAIFENAMESISQSTPDGRFVAANPALAKMLGYDSPDELMTSVTDIGRQLYVHPPQRLEMTRLLARIDRVKDFQAQLFRKDGTKIWTTMDVTTIRDIEGNLLYYQGAMLDITDRKRAAEEKEKLEAQLQHAQKMESVGRLAGGVAHDFNNMLNVIIGHTEIVLGQLSPSAKFYHNLHEIRNAASRSADLVRQLLAFARRQMAMPRVLDLNETIENMLKMLRRLIGEDIELAWTPGAGLWHVKIDPSQIDQVLANLAVNARDAISGVGTISIETLNVVLDDAYCAGYAGFIPGEYVQLTVSDTGVGMSREVLEHLFEPFFTTKEIGQGTGLGLATVYGIIRQNEGFINVYSEPTKGAIFKIYLPRIQADSKTLRDGQASAGSAGVPPGGEETILLVEDDEALLDLSKTILEDLGYTVISTQSPVEAIRLVTKHPGDIHLLITDVVMPGMNGRELEERLLKIRPSLKCLYMSGYTANMIAHRGILEEGVHFLSKPFRRGDLAEKVRLALAAG